MFLLTDIIYYDTFNEDNYTAMLWEVRHKWTSGARFSLNCYHHWATLVIRAGESTGRFLHSKEGVTQGYPLTMIAYGLGILPLIRDLQTSYPSVNQP